MIKRGIHFGKKVAADRLVRSSARLCVAVVTGGVANYGLQVLLGRLLSTTQYGFFNALLGMFVVLGVPVTTLMMLVSRKTAEYRVSRSLASVSFLLHSVSKRVFEAGLVGLLIYLCLLNPLSRLLHSASFTPIILLGLCVIASIVMPIPLAVLQGLQMNSWFSFFQGFGGPARLVCCGFAAWMGFDVPGVMVGLLLSVLIVWAWSHLVAKKIIGPYPHRQKEEHLAWREAAPVLVANFAFALISQMDLVLVNHYFQPQDASLYASAAVLGRSVIYVPGALVLALFPMVSENKAKNINTRPLLLKSLALTVALSGVGAFLFFMWPGEIMTLLFGHRYAGSAVVLKYYGLTMLPLAMLMVLVYYLIAHGNSAFGFVMLAGAIAQALAIALFHPTLLSVVFIFGTVGVVLLGCGLFFALSHSTATAANSGNYVSSLGV